MDLIPQSAGPTTSPTGKARFPIDFWAKTTEDGRPGISVRDHCLIFAAWRRRSRFRSGRLAAARQLSRLLSEHFLQGNGQSGLHLRHRFFEQLIQRTAGTGVFFHFLVPNVFLPLVEPLCQLPELLAGKVLDGGLEFQQINALPAPVRPLLPHGTAILAALRHVGKLSAGFQQKCPAWLEEMEFKARWAKEDWNNSEREARSQFRNESSPCA
jgi:hypothetical protein